MQAKFVALILRDAAIVVSATCVGSPALAGFVSFDPPGSNFTMPLRINDAGAIVGFWFDGNLYHGFLRASDGGITSFDPPGSVETTPLDINDKGVIVGTYTTDTHTPKFYHGFIRNANGRITSYDAPKSGGYTSIWAINKARTITGYYADENSGNYHGFVRDSAGHFASFDPPDSLDTNPMAINSDGTITGYYAYQGTNQCGTAIAAAFVRAVDGTITTFNVRTGAYPASINSHDTIAGQYTDDNCVVYGFIRRAGGNTKLFSFPGDNNDLYVEDMNRHGTVAGWFFDGQEVDHGFQRAPDGTITKIEPSGAKASEAHGINASGQIVGFHIDKNQQGLHGFLYTP